LGERRGRGEKGAKTGPLTVRSGTRHYLLAKSPGGDRKILFERGVPDHGRVGDACDVKVKNPGGNRKLRRTTLWGGGILKGGSYWKNVAN